MDPSSRQERLQMRQRGAATRQVNAVDFGLSFDPTPRRSARNTPQQASRSRQARTPSTARGAASRRSSRTPSRASKLPENVANHQPHHKASSPSVRPPMEGYHLPQGGSETRAMKRRKLSSEHEINQLITPATSQGSNLVLSQERPENRGRQSSAPHPIQIAEIPEQPQRGLPLQGEKLASWFGPIADKENAVPGPPMSKRTRSASKRRRSMVEISNGTRRRDRSSRSASIESDNVSIRSAVGDIDSEDEVLVAVLEDTDDESIQDQQEGVSLMTVQGEWPDSTLELVAILDDTTTNLDDTAIHSATEPSLLTQGQPETPAPRVANIKKKRDLFKTPTLPSTNPRASGSPSSSRLPISDQIPETQATLPPHPESDRSWNQAGQDEDETYLQPTSPVIPTPKTVAKKPRKRAAATKARSRRRSSAGTDNQNKGGPKSKSATFPVVCRRLTNTSALPTIPEEQEEQEEEEEATQDEDSINDTITTKKPNFDRRNPNSVDILSQFCLEHIDSATNPHNTNSTHHQIALHSLTSTLDRRLTDLSIQTDHRLNLGSQLRKSIRDKVAKREEWIQTRRDRQDVRRRIEEMQRRRDEVDEWDRCQWRVGEGLWRLEMEVERACSGKGTNDPVTDGGGGVDDLEFRLTKAAAASASRLGTRDLLGRVRGFNDVLEATLKVLDDGVVGGGGGGGGGQGRSR